MKEILLKVVTVSIVVVVVYYLYAYYTWQLHPGISLGL
jgi:hypothetical protein